MFQKVLVAVIVMALFASGVWAEESEVTWDKIVVTPYRYEETLSKTASSVTVITAAEIKNSNAAKVIDALRPVPGIIVRDLYGNGAKASLDLRGFGDMDAMNILVLIDGRRVNEVDLSGVDWSQVPLDQIQQIEIIRGGNSVLYGENAVGGVINIITKKGQGKPRFEISSEFGSYDRNSEKIHFSGSRGKLSYLFSASREGTHGYRNNSFFKTYDYSSKLGYDFSDELTVYFNSGFHRASYGLPGGLSENESAITEGVLQKTGMTALPIKTIIL